MKILVYGAGNIGSLYAAQLKRSGQDVRILARGRRLESIRERGIELENFITGEKTTTPIETVERLGRENAYDLVLVILPKHRVSEVLPTLAENRRTPSVMFMVNSAAGPREMSDALKSDRVLLGFPGAAGVTEGGVLRFLITSAREQPTTIGEVDGSSSSRIQAIAEAFKEAGFPVAICSNMDAWLKTHVAEIGPTAGALYMSGGDPERLARTRDAMLLMLRAIREGYRVLREHEIPITPANHRIFEWLPEPLLLGIMRRLITSDETAIKVGHAMEAREEMQLLADEFRALAQKTSVPTPAVDRLTTYLDPRAEPVADGSAEMPVRWPLFSR